ncbi:MAG: ATP-dependent Clp protease proteolytic subunit [Candidatus Hodgkinia cicadicola]|nr:MAG: ATP-dependent Clp protease proteolytic subunit [Candidatus Hodgkinia cicadicola]
MESRIILLTDEITAQAAAAACALLLVLEAEAPEKHILMYINSPGGDVSAGLAIYDTMQLIKPNVATLCVGQALSTASLLLAGGAKGRRYCTPNSSVMTHQLSGSACGQASDMKIHVLNMIEQEKTITRIYMKHCSKTCTEVEKALDRDCFMTPSQALKWGIIDFVISKRA